MAMQQLAAVPVLLSSILLSIPSVLVPASRPSVSSPFLPSSVSATTPTLTFVFLAICLPSAYDVFSPHFSSPLGTSSSVPRSVALEPAASCSPRRGPVNALLHECLVRRNAEFVKLSNTFLVREDCVL